jgi:hypothetical protein
MTWQLLEEAMEVVMEKPPAHLACHSQLKGVLLDWIGKMDGRMDGCYGDDAYLQSVASPK